VDRALISPEMLLYKNHSAFAHLPYTSHSRIKVTINAIAVIIGCAGGTPFSYRFFHLVANHTSALRIMLPGDVKGRNETGQNQEGQHQGHTFRDFAKGFK